MDEIRTPFEPFSKICVFFDKTYVFFIKKWKKMQKNKIINFYNWTIESRSTFQGEFNGVNYKTQLK